MTTKIYVRVLGEATHTAYVTIGHDGKARISEDQLHHLLQEAGYVQTTKEPNQ